MHTNIAWEEHHGRGRLTRVLHVIAQRRPRAHFKAGDDTAELAIVPPPRDRDRSRVAALYEYVVCREAFIIRSRLSLLGGLSRKKIILTFYRDISHLSYGHLPKGQRCVTV